jgi:hypothetical protein
MRDSYKETRTIEFEGMVARVHFPDISAEERTRRMKRIHSTASNLLKGERKNVLDR